VNRFNFQPETGYIDYEKLRYTSQLFRPKVIIAGTTAYSRLLDYKAFREASIPYMQTLYLYFTN